MAETSSILVKGLLPQEADILGKSDGYLIAQEILKALQSTTNDARVDFQGIVGASPSSACMLLVTITDALGEAALSRVEFVNVESRVAEALKDAFEHLREIKILAE